MTSDLSTPCVHCGNRSEPHHHREGPGPVGKGSGGLGPHEHLPEIPLCRKAHNAVHANELQLSLDGDVATGRENGMVVFERGITVWDELMDSRFWSDTKLSDEWAAGEGKAQEGFEQQCNAAFEFHRRYRGHPEWSVRVAEIISENNGQYIHPREVYRRIRLYVAFNDDWTTYRRLGKTLALAVAESGDIKSALEIAEAAKDEGGRTSTSIIREIRGQADPLGCTCPDCGHEHRQRSTS